MELRSILLRMQIYDELQKDFLFYALERTILIRKREATNYFRLMTLFVDQSDSNELVTRRSVIWLAAVQPPLQVSAYLVMGNISGYGKIFRSKAEISSARGFAGQ